MSLKAYQAPKCCTAVSNSMKQDFTTLEDYQSGNNFIILATITRKTVGVHRSHYNQNCTLVSIYDWPMQCLVGLCCISAKLRTSIVVLLKGIMGLCYIPANVGLNMAEVGRGAPRFCFIA